MRGSESLAESDMILLWAFSSSNQSNILTAMMKTTHKHLPFSNRDVRQHASTVVQNQMWLSSLLFLVWSKYKKNFNWEVFSHKIMMFFFTIVRLLLHQGYDSERQNWLIFCKTKIWSSAPLCHDGIPVTVSVSVITSCCCVSLATFTWSLVSH